MTDLDEPPPAEASPCGEDCPWCQGHPVGPRVVLHAAALDLVGVAYCGLGELVWRIASWLNGHLDDGSPWARRGYAYRHRAFRVMRPWWCSREELASRSTRGHLNPRVRLTDLDHDDPSLPRPGLGCSIRIVHDAVLLVRDPDCTLHQVRTICQRLLRGELEVIDRTG